jgi:hypothetical protein
MLSKFALGVDARWLRFGRWITPKSLISLDSLSGLFSPVFVGGAAVQATLRAIVCSRSAQCLGNFDKVLPHLPQLVGIEGDHAVEHGAAAAE